MNNLGFRHRENKQKKEKVGYGDAATWKADHAPSGQGQGTWVGHRNNCCTVLGPSMSSCTILSWLDLPKEKNPNLNPACVK